MKTRFFSLIIIAVMLIPSLLLASCGGSTEYSADVPVSELCSAADALLPDSSDFATTSDSYIIGMMEIDPTEFADYAVKIRASGANIDEYGIFKAADSSEVEAAVSVVNAYLAMRVDTWMPEYMPEEFPKMEEASVKVFGQYVVYAILADDVKADVFNAIEEKLLEK